VFTLSHHVSHFLHSLFSLWIFQIWIVGEKVGEGMGRTRKEAQRQAAHISLRNLAGEFYLVFPSLSTPDKKWQIYN
jgi:acetone carboxylase gamma subunit